MIPTLLEGDRVEDVEGESTREFRNISSNTNIRWQEYKKLINRHLVFDLIKKCRKQWKSFLLLLLLSRFSRVRLCATP